MAGRSGEYSPNDSFESHIVYKEDDDLEEGRQLPRTPEQKTLERATLFLVGGLLFADYFLLSCVIPILPHLLTDDFGIQKWLVYLLFSSKAFFQVVFNPWGAKMVRVHGAKGPMLAATIILGVSTVVFGVVIDTVDTKWSLYSLLFVARSVQGFASALIMCSGMSLVASIVPAERRGEGMGSAMLGMGLAVVLGVPLGGVFASFISDSVSFYFIAACTAGLGVMQFFLWRGVFGEPPKITDETIGSDEEEFSFRHLFSDRCLLLVALANILGNASLALLEPVLPIYVANEFGYTHNWQQGLFVGIAAVGFLVATPVSGILCDKMREDYLITIGLALTSVGLCLVGAVKEPWFAGICVLLAGAGNGAITTPTMPLLGKIADFNNHPYAVVYSVQDVSANLGFILGPWVASVITLSGGNSVSLLYITIPLGALTGLIAPLMQFSQPKVKGSMEEPLMRDSDKEMIAY